MGNYHARCGAGEKSEVATPEAYLSLFALPEDFCSLLSTMRSREISCNIIIQNLAQIKALFEKTWETIPGNSDTMVYLGGNEASTHKYISEALGKWTIDKRTTGESLGKNGSASKNYDVIGRELLTPDEVRKMPNEKCLVFIRGMDPVYDFKYKIFEKKEFQEAVSYGAYGTGPAAELDQRKEKTNMNREETKDLEVLSSKEVEYYRNLKESGGASVVEVTAEQLLDLDLTGIQEVTEEEAGELLNEEEYQKILEASAAEDEAVKEECERLEACIKTAKEEDQEHAETLELKEMGLAERMAYGKFTPDQVKEAYLGMEAGLSERMILLYFLPEFTPEHMREMRKLAVNAIE